MNGKQVVRYRRLASDAELAPVAANTDRAHAWHVWFFEPDNNHVYAEISEHGEPGTLYRFALAEGTRERIAGNPTMEVTGIERAGYLGNPFAVTYSAGRPKIDFTDAKSEWAQLYSGLMKLFPGRVGQTSQEVTRDNNKVLFFVLQRSPSRRLLPIRSQPPRTPQLLFETMAWIESGEACRRRTPIEFKNRGGDTSERVLHRTLGQDTARTPLVVMPHGGPFGVIRRLGIRPGRAVPGEPRLRRAAGELPRLGRPGRGFHASPPTSSGAPESRTTSPTASMHRSPRRLVDSSKVCIYGASFGGYSAMMNPIRNPGMYKCAIGYAGVYDLAKLYADRDGSRQGAQLLRSHDGRGRGRMFARQSPTTLRREASTRRCC